MFHQSRSASRLASSSGGVIACDRGDVVGDVCISSLLSVFGGGVMGMLFIVVVVVVVVVISVGMFSIVVCSCEVASIACWSACG